MAKIKTTKAAEPKAESMPIRIPFPVEPSLLVILIITVSLICIAACADICSSVCLSEWVAQVAECVFADLARFLLIVSLSN